MCGRRSGRGCFCAAQVKGKRLDTESGIRTRSRAATQREQYEAVPAPVQIFVLLADMLIEAREGARPEHNSICSFIAPKHGKALCRTGRATRLSPEPGSSSMARVLQHICLKIVNLGFAQIYSLAQSVQASNTPGCVQGI